MAETGVTWGVTFLSEPVGALTGGGATENTGDVRALVKRARDDLLKTFMGYGPAYHVGEVQFQWTINNRPQPTKFNLGINYLVAFRLILGASIPALICRACLPVRFAVPQINGGDRHQSE